MITSQPRRPAPAARIGANVPPAGAGAGTGSGTTCAKAAWLADQARRLGLVVEVRDKTTDGASGWTAVHVERSGAPGGPASSVAQDGEWISATFAWDKRRRSERLLTAEKRTSGGGVRNVPRTMADVYRAFGALARFGPGQEMPTNNSDRTEKQSWSRPEVVPPSTGGRDHA